MYDALGTLVDGWCERRDLHPLAVLLPAYTSNNGLTDGWAGVLDALSTLRADRQLADDEAAVVGRLVAMVEAIVHHS